MNNQEQTNAVKKALDLSILVSNTKNELALLSCQTYGPKPNAPVAQKIPTVYPEIKPEVKFWSIELLPTICFWPWPIIYYFTGYKRKKELEIFRIRDTPEYRQQCAAIDDEVKKKQAAADELYQKQLKEYQDVILPKYEKALAEWTQMHNKEIERVKTILHSAEKDLSEHYEATKIVPLQYREISALQYIYDSISTSDYSVKEAIDAYDKDRQRRLDQAQINEQRRANNLAREQNDLAMEQNDLLAEQNDIADRARRDARTAAIVGAVQRHNTNKALNKIIKGK